MFRRKLIWLELRRKTKERQASWPSQHPLRGKQRRQESLAFNLRQRCVSANSCEELCPDRETKLSCEAGGCLGLWSVSKGKVTLFS